MLVLGRSRCCCAGETCRELQQVQAPIVKRLIIYGEPQPMAARAREHDVGDCAADVDHAWIAMPE